MNTLYRSARHTVAKCTCSPALLAPAVPRSRAFSSALRRANEDKPSPSPADAPLPWFVDPSSLSTAASPSPRLAKAAIPLPPPPHLPSSLHPLHAHLSVSPFLDRDAITFINAREADPENSWVEWVVVASLRPGREGGLRGAIEGVRTFVRSLPVRVPHSALTVSWMHSCPRRRSTSRPRRL